MVSKTWLKVSSSVLLYSRPTAPTPPKLLIICWVLYAHGEETGERKDNIL